MGNVSSKLRRRSSRARPGEIRLAEIELEFSEPQSRATCGRLLLEVMDARQIDRHHLLRVHEGRVSRDHVRLTVGPVDERAQRLDAVRADLGHLPISSSLPLAEYVLRQLTNALSELAAASTSRVHRPTHGRLCSRAVLIQPEGALTLVGGGYLSLTDLLIPPIADGTAGLNWDAPEVIRLEPATHLSDVYSLGAILYELIAGVPYRSSMTELELRAAAFSDRPPDLSEGLGEAPRPLLNLLAWSLAPTREGRCPRAQTLSTELTALTRTLGLGRWTESEFVRFLEARPAGDRVRGLSVLGNVDAASPLDRPLAQVLGLRPRAAEAELESIVILEPEWSEASTAPGLRPRRGPPPVPIDAPPVDPIPFAAAALAEPLVTEDLAGEPPEVTRPLLAARSTTRLSMLLFTLAAVLGLGALALLAGY